MMLWLRMIRGADEEAVFSQTAKLNDSGDRMWVRYCSASSKVSKTQLNMP